MDAGTPKTVSPSPSHGGGRARVLIAAVFYTQVSYLVWIALGPLGVHIGAETGLAPADLALLVALPIIVGTVLRFPVGLAVDRFGAVRVGVATQAGLLIALFIIWRLETGQPAGLYGAAALLGLGGVSFSVALPMVGGWFPAQSQGRALGLTAVGGGGAVVTSLAAPTLAANLAWQDVVGLGLVPVAVSLVVFILLARDAPVRRVPLSLAQYLLVLRYADTFWFSLFYAVTFGGFISLAATLVVYLHDSFAFSPAHAGTIAAISLLAGSASRLLGGWLADRRGGIRTLKAVFALCALALTGLAVVPGSAPGAAVGLLLVVLAALGAGNGALFQLISVRFARQMGVMTGLVGAAGGVGGFVLTWGHGLMRESSGDYGTGFAVHAALALIALAGLWTVKRRWRTTWGAPAITRARV